MFVISVHLVLVPDSQWVVLLQPFSMQVLLHRYHDPSLSPSSTNIILRWNEKKTLAFLPLFYSGRQSKDCYDCYGNTGKKIDGSVGGCNKVLVAVGVRATWITAPNQLER